VTDLVSRFGGRLVKFIGDEAMFVVEDPSRACELALALVEAFAADPALPPVRVGLAAGPAVALHGDYYGEVVNLAARLAKAGGASDVIVAESVRQELGEGFAFAPASALALKGFDSSVTGFRLLRRPS
jgi:class 3 adenylate cyclase